MIIRNDNITEASLNSASDLNASIFLSKVSAVGTVTPTMITAVDELFKGLKSTNLWNKITAFYPLIGGTEASCSVEGKGTTSYDLDFFGGMTFSQNGATGNRTTGYALVGSQKYTPAEIFASANNLHYSWYNMNSRGTPPDGELWVNVSPSQQAAGSFMNLVILYNSKSYMGNGYVNEDNYPQWTDASSQGFYLSSRTNSATQKAYKNGLLVASGLLDRTNILDTDNSLGFWVSTGGREGGGAYSADTSGFITFGTGLSDAEALDLYNTIQSFQTSLGRAV